MCVVTLNDMHEDIRAAVQALPGTIITDLHIWQIGVNKFAAIISVAAPAPKTPAGRNSGVRSGLVAPGEFNGIL